MGRLLNKEFRLAMHPTCYLFLGLAAMMLIPGYPLYVTFFYMALAVFFTCMSGRENRDVTYTLLLPVGKADVVRARMGATVVLELAQLLLAVVFAVLRSVLHIGANPAGMDANMAFFGVSLALLGLFNLVFFGSYYRNVQKVGTAFLKGCVAMLLYIGVAETLVHALPFAREVLDTPDPQHMLPKAVVLGVGIGLYVGMTAYAYCRAKHAFAQQDL